MQMQESMSSAKHELLTSVRKPGSLSRRLAFNNVIILFVVLMIAGGAIYALVSYYLTTNADTLLQTEGKKLQTATYAWRAQGHPLDETFLSYLVNQDQVDEFDSQPISVKLLDPHTSALLKRSANLEITHLPLALPDFQAALRGQSVLNTYQNTSGQQVRVLTQPLRSASQHIVVVAQVSLSLESIKQVQTALAVFLLGSSIVGALIAYNFALFLVKRELRPLALLGQTMDEVTTQGLHVRVSPQQRTSEVQVLSTAFNHMLRQLETSFLRQEDFVADISHELRTPLTAIRGQIDVLLLKPEHSEETRQDLAGVQAEIGRLSRLVANLLTHARAEIGILPQVNSAYSAPVDLDGLLLEILHQLRFLKPQVTIAFQRFQPCEVPGDRDLLKQLFFNLLDNAVTYTPSGGRITLDLTCAKKFSFSFFKDKPAGNAFWAKVAISNTGAGISKADLPHIFERHYRASHDVAQGKQRSGLGLPIALMIAQTHGGTITAESVLDKGTCFTIWLPLSAQPADSIQAGLPASSEEASVGERE